MVGLSPSVAPPHTAISRDVATFCAGDGLALTFERFGAPDAPPVLFAHGFGQTRHAWTAAAIGLAGDGWCCLSADARGHGDSGWRADGAYEFGQFIDDLVLLAQRSARAPAPAKPVLVGASMGGLLGLAAQAAHDVFRALVLVDITPRWESAGVERIMAFMRAHPDGFASAEEAADAIAHYLPQRRERKSPERLRSLLVPLANGRLRWHWDPHLLERIAAGSENQQEALLDAAPRIRVQTLLISGAQSDVVSASTIDEFLSCVPHARHVRVAQATHMIVGDRNDAFVAAVRDFIEDVRRET
jgi:pimeloyl-ACP methyl ester carboxylesterase